MGRWPDPNDKIVRQTHLDFCIGCKLINETRGPEERWILCFEYADRAGYATRELVSLYDTVNNAMAASKNRGLPTGESGAVTLKALIDDVSSRFEKGTLVTGEARANGG